MTTISFVVLSISLGIVTHTDCSLLQYDADAPSLQIAERVRVHQSTLIVPGSQVGLEGHLRVWLGGREAFLREGLRRIGAELTALLD